jgi:cyclic pyranopterin monophosphate synthase
MSEGGFTHLDEQGRPRMVDVGDKAPTRRVAVAEGRIRTSAETLRAIVEGTSAKGNVLMVARLAGIMGAKRTADLIPLCHPVPLEAVEVEVEPDEALPGVRARATARVEAKTGVEMEALTAVSCALLTIYDMCKARDRGMVIEEIRLISKEGGRSGRWTAETDG